MIAVECRSHHGTAACGAASIRGGFRLDAVTGYHPDGAWRGRLHREGSASPAAAMLVSAHCDQAAFHHLPQEPS
ncbi:MAG: hypothetical protein JSR26_08745 [Proteobacteria bacterium]|nr:hypothetical protein [Pseudomonadota bacterium]